MPLLNTLMKFARTPQGRRAMNRAMSYARSPQGRKQIAQVQRQLSARRKPR
ncbi:hypothetical protein DVA67_025080 [Solirubrobacter sp. CPCC 204708]|uniref:Uncharacterized protein n=1 Tax=Solirubrobacter deserti TaxID=2282478 RepID=A0ABT4RRQ4_9ACTN|nr:hypothetical protein [Solirubrobacter deserti]MBE2319275.1 hypothetical protein [Solirubrobacter deserti]MDA0141140.1 hypothetical protein [Solirubrobacter deserti]